MSKKRQAETQASLAIITLGAALETLGSPKEAIAAIEKSLAPKVDPKPTTINEPSLPALAKQINAAFAAIDGATLALTDKRIEAGTLLKLARERMPEKGAFADWCKANVKRGKSDIYRCLALVKSTDPVEQATAREAEKAAARDTMAASRERQAANPVPNVGDKPKQPSPALAAINNAKPAPSAAVWSEPASQTRDKAVVAQVTGLSALTGAALADAMENQIRLLVDLKHYTIAAPRLALMVEMIETKLITRLRNPPKPLT